MLGAAGMFATTGTALIAVRTLAVSTPAVLASSRSVDRTRA
jgi:hypothetical protein